MNDDIEAAALSGMVNETWDRSARSDGRTAREGPRGSPEAERLAELRGFDRD